MHCRESMDVAFALFYRIFTTVWTLLSTLLHVIGKQKTVCRERQEILQWVSESDGTAITSLQQLWDIGPSTLGRYIEQLNGRNVTWWSLQDLARSTFAVPQVMTRQEMAQSVLEEKTEKKFLRLLMRLKEALDRIEGTEGSHRFRVSSDIVAKGVALSSAYTKMRGVFFVYSYSNDLENINIEMNGPNIVKVETKMRKNGLMVGYTVMRSGIYTLEISKNNWFAPGSPFQVNIQDPPVGYKGGFGSSMWDKSEREEFLTSPSVIDRNSPPNSMTWDDYREEPQTYKMTKKAFPSRPQRKKKTYAEPSKQQVVELSQIAAAIILARRFTNRMQSRIPDLRVERNSDDQTELNLWSAITSPPPSLREITYVSPEGATFPISVTGRSQRERERERERDGERERGRGNGHKKWIGPPGHETYEDWFYGPPPAAPRAEAEAASKARKEPIFPPLNMVRPFNHEVTSSESEASKIVHGRVWSQCRSIGVNTDDICNKISTNPSEPNIFKLSKAIQVGETFILHNQIGDPSIDDDKSAPTPDESRTSGKGLPLREQINHDSALLRARKSETFNSDDTSSSGMTNYSEKVIEMDLKVNYETIALTSTDDELSQSESRGRARERTNSYLNTLNDGMASSMATSTNEVADEKEDFYLEPSLGSDNFESDKPTDGIYKATLMSIDASSTAEGDLCSGNDEKCEFKNYNNPSEYSKFVGSQWVAGGTMEEALYHQSDDMKSFYEPLSASDGQLLTIIVDDETSGKLCEDPNHIHLYYPRNFSQNGTIDEVLPIERKNAEKTKRNLEFQHFKYLTKRKWTKKLSTHRVLKQKGGTCKRHLRKTLSFMQAFDDYKKHGCPNKGNAIYSFGPYPVKKDIIHIPTPVRAWRDFWDNMASRTETRLRKDFSNLNRGFLKGKHPSSITGDQTVEEPVRRESLKDEDRKRRFETAKQHFTELEKDEVKTFIGEPIIMAKSEDIFYEPQKLHRWDLKDLFKDFNKGLGKPGVANRLGVLATLQSVEPVFNIGGFESQYPHLPVICRNDSSIVDFEATAHTRTKE